MPSNLRRAVKSFIASPVKEEKTYRRIDEPGLALDLAALLERNSLPAKSQGLPAIGSKLLNPHGLEFVVEGHIHVPTAATIQDWRDGKAGSPKNLYPSIVPRNLSARLLSFIEKVDRCTTKTLLVLDTMPLSRRDSGVPGGHWIDTYGNAGANLLFIDAASIHETHFAHEIGHLWVQYVDQAEDDRVLIDMSDPARTNQFSFIQSFVIDFRVNEIIESQGFDMTVIRQDQTDSIASLGRAIAAGYRPDNKREGVFMALTLATEMLESRRIDGNTLASTEYTIQQAHVHCSELFELASKFAKTIRANGYREKDSIKQSIDECLEIAFEFTDGGIDLIRDLETPNVKEPDFDKYPQWLENAPTTFKCEVGRVIAREGIPTECEWTLIQGPDHFCSIMFKTASGVSVGTYVLDHQFPEPPPFNHRQHLQRINEINRQNSERKMKQQPSSTSPLANIPSQPHRFYMAGTGRFLTRVREEEWLGGESAYGYAKGNPVTYIDPDGLKPKGGEKTGCKVYKCHNRGFLSHACLSVVGPNGGCSASSYMEGLSSCPGAEKDPTLWDCTLVSTDCSLAGEVCGCIARAYKGGGWTGFWGQGMCWGSAISYLCCGCQNLPHGSIDCLSKHCPPIFCPPPRCGPSRGSGGAGSLPII